MSGKSARAARKAAAPKPIIESAWKTQPPAYQSLAVPAGTCWICGAASHKELAATFAGTASTSAGIFSNPGVQDAVGHALIAAHGPISERTETGSEEWQRAFAEQARSIGLLCVAVEHFARADEFKKVAERITKQVAVEAVEVFFEQILERSGEGVYQFEIRRNRDGVVQHRRVN